MFIDFFYFLRSNDIKVSVIEWMDLMEALDKGLCNPSLIDFYYLCRCLLIKSETEYDKFDIAFYQYFKELKSPIDIPDQVWEWLNNGLIRTKEDLFDLIDITSDKDLNKLKRMLEERIEEQKGSHKGGNYWIGTGGTSVLGHGGYANQGIRIGGSGRYQFALQIAERREFRDFRQDQILDTRQFEMAFRRLRQLSSDTDSPKTELDIEKTIESTSNRGGILDLVFKRPRKNTIKLLLLFDSDGSMLIYSRLCSALFHALDKSNHFADLKVYYFHNCIYEHLYTDPGCIRGKWVDTEWVLRNLDSGYRLIIVGDASMAPSELLMAGGNCMIGLYNEVPGIEWLQRLTKKYAHHIWLNPIAKDYWNKAYGYYTINKIRDIFPMYELSVEGMEKGIKKLMVNR